MAYFKDDELKMMGFKFIGKNVKISTKASIYNCDCISINDNSRIDDFCVISGNVDIGKYCHITPSCLIAGGIPGVVMQDFATLAYGVKVFSQSDDYSGETMVNSLVPKKYKNEIFESVNIGKHVIVGAASVIFPGVIISEGCAIGAMTLINRSTDPWGVYVGNPARRVKNRKQDLLFLEKEFLKDLENDSI